MNKITNLTRIRTKRYKIFGHIRVGMEATILLYYIHQMASSYIKSV
jgi:hypothetical protein